MTEFQIGVEVYRTAGPMAIEHYAYYETQGREPIPPKLFPILQEQCALFYQLKPNKTFQFFAYTMELATPLLDPEGPPIRISSMIFELLFIFNQLDRIGFQHNDLKSDNIVVKKHEGPIREYAHKDSPYVVALIDFGYAITRTYPIQGPFTSISVYGTRTSIPPEGLLLRAVHKRIDANTDDFEIIARAKTIAGDTWAIGVILISSVIPAYWRLPDFNSKPVALFARQMNEYAGLELETDPQKVNEQPGFNDLVFFITWYGFLYFLNKRVFPSIEVPKEPQSTESDYLRQFPYYSQIQTFILKEGIGHHLYTILLGKWGNNEDSEYLNLLRQLLQWYPEDRPHPNILLEHPLFASMTIDSRICMQCRQRPATLQEECNPKYTYCSNKCAKGSFI